MDEFNSIFDVQSLSLLPDGILIVWKWTHQLLHHHKDTVIPEECGEMNDSDFAKGSEVTHTLTFKSIGSNSIPGHFKPVAFTFGKCECQAVP